MKKSSFFRGMFDGLRSTVSQPSGSGAKCELEVDETLKSEHFAVANIVRQGFPHSPTALAFDPIQRLIAIGNKNGSIRVLGRPGVDVHAHHVTEQAVIDMKFVINTGTLITVTADDSIHLWSLTAKPIEIVHSLKFQKERITYSHLSFQSKWLYIGTEKGNVHVVNIDSFLLSGYIIMWNKAIELSRKTHPGAIVHISDCPCDSNKLLLGFECGVIVLWDLRNKSADFRHQYSSENCTLKSISWHHEGRQFICSHSDGSLTTWNVKSMAKPVSVVYPHATRPTDLVPPDPPLKPIYKTEWKTVRNGDSYIIFSGGLPVNTASQSANESTSGQLPSSSSSSSLPLRLERLGADTQTLTVIHGKTTTVLEMEHSIVDFLTLCDSPYETDFNDPYAIVVLLHNDLVVVDLLSAGYPCFQNPYSMDLHESPVTYCHYVADCPTDLIPAFYSVGYKGTKRSGFSEKEWPISGGEWGSSTLSYPEIIITGHADGSLKFWDASSVNLQVLYKLKTSKLFEKPRLNKASVANASASSGGENYSSSQQQQQESNGLQEIDDPFAIEQLAFCADSRYLCCAGASSQLIVFRFSKHEAHTEVPVIEIAMKYDCESDHELNETEVSAAVGYSFLANDALHDTGGSGGGVGCGGVGGGCNSAAFYLLQAKCGHHRRAPGFQPELVCLSPYIDRVTPPYRITALCVNSAASLVAYGCENGLIIIDTIQKCAVLNVATPDLYGTADPYQRIVRSSTTSKRTAITSTGTTAPLSRDNTDGSGGGNQGDAGDRCKSPTSEQYDDSRFTPESVADTTASSTSVPTTPVSPHASSSFEVPVPPPRTKRKPSAPKESVVSVAAVVAHAKHSNLSEQLSNNTGGDKVVINDATSSSHCCSVVYTKNERPNDLNLRPKEKLAITKSNASTASTADSSSSAGSDERSNHYNNSNNNDSALPSPSTADTVDHNHHPLLLSRVNSHTGSGSNANNAKLVQSNNSQSSSKTAKKFRIYDLRSNDRDESVMTRIFSKQQQQQQQQQPASSSLPNTTTPSTTPSSKKQVTPEMKRSRSQGTRSKLQKMHTIQSMASTDEGLLSYNLGVSTGSDKIDSSFSRSRSSSVSSLENVAIEAVQYIAFADTYCTKSDATTGPSVWVGTSLGSVLVISLTLPDSTDNRILCLQAVTAQPSGSIYRLKGIILCLSFLDFTGTLLHHNFDAWKDSASKPTADNTTPSSTCSLDYKRSGSLTITRSGSGGAASTQAGTGGGGGVGARGNTKISPTSSSTDMRDSHFAVMVSEKQIRIVNLPSQVCSYKATLTETSFAVRADVVYMKSCDSVCLAVYLATGNIVVYSLPSLRLLIDIDFLPLTDVRIARTISFSANGHGIYLSSPSELTKFTISAAFKANIPDMIGTLFAPKELPEAPKPSFLRGLFGGGPSSLDREELFGETNAGKPSKTTARHIPGTTEQVKTQTGSLASEMSRLREGFTERGERLSQIEDKTAKMQSEAEAFGTLSHNVMLKYRDKKWYQF